MSTADTDRDESDSVVVEALPRIDSDQDYLKILELSERSFDALCAKGIVPIVPSLRRRTAAIIELSEFGRVPRSLLHVTGLFDKIAAYVVSSLVPWCSVCSREAVRPKSIIDFNLPSEGVVVISIVDDTDGFSLHERCELLGLERAIVHNKLVRSIDTAEMRGEPVLCVASGREPELIHSEAARWFSRGGGALRVLHFASRDSTGIELGEVQKSWLCSRCNRTLEMPSRAELLEVNPCQVCNGKGWFEVAEEPSGIRQRACRECHGIGSKSDFFSYRFRGEPLSRIMCLSFSELAQALQTDGQATAAELSGFIARVCNAGFATYPLGAAVDLFSPGENARLAALVGELGMLTGVRYLLDTAYSPYADCAGAGEIEQERLILASPVSRAPQKKESQTSSSHEFIRLRDLRQGPLRIAELLIPLGEVTAIQGPTGSGKSLLLEKIAFQFAKRRKLAHMASFGRLQHCTLLSGLVDSSGTVLELLGLSRDLAAEIARTRKAKALSLLERDLELPRSKFRCPECSGMGHAANGDLCGSCQGSLFDWRVATLEVLGLSLVELLRAPIQQLGGLLWTQSATEAVIKLVAAQGDGSISLSTLVRHLNPSTRRFLKLLGGLGRFGGAFAPGSEKPSLSKELILIDGPHAMPDEHQRTVQSLLLSLQKRGATVVYASMPESLEMMAQSVIRLEFEVLELTQRAEDEFLDARYAQGSRAAFS